MFWLLDLQIIIKILDRLKKLKTFDITFDASYNQTHIISPTDKLQTIQITVSKILICEKITIRGEIISR